MKEIQDPEGASLGVIVFTTANARFAAADVLDSAWFRGELQALWSGRCAGQSSAANDDEIPPADEELQAIAEEIRYRHELITAEETDAWLDARRLTLDDLTDHCHRQWRWENAPPPVVVAGFDYSGAAVELRELFLHELIFDGTFDTLARQLTWRVAIPAEAGDHVPATMETQRAQFHGRMGLTKEAVEETLRRLGRDAAWLDATLAREAGYARHLALVLTIENRHRNLAALRLPLTRFEVELLELESEDAAREACLCLEVDGLSMDDLAEQEHYRMDHREFLLEELPPEEQLQFLRGEKGQVRQVTTTDGRFQVFRIVDKCEPTLADKRVISRVDREILAAHFENLVSKNVAWLLQPASSS
jgi:hypothetical protein